MVQFDVTVAVSHALFLSVGLLLASSSLAQNTTVQRNRNLDRFNYDVTVQTDTLFNFGPADWGDLRCPDVDICVRVKHLAYVVCLGQTMLVHQISLILTVASLHVHVFRFFFY
jgi:hypothetical protein